MLLLTVEEYTFYFNISIEEYGTYAKKKKFKIKIELN